jgi:hypothetical protein
VDEGAKFLLLLWRTWQVRNDLMHESEKLWFCRVSKVAGRQDRQASTPMRWIPPELGWLNVDVDGAFDSTSGGGGGGGAPLA